MSSFRCPKCHLWNDEHTQDCSVRLQAELARLRAEVEKERAGKRSFYELMLQAERERDAARAERDKYLGDLGSALHDLNAALARLANCGQENCMGWKLENHTNWVTEDRYNEALAQVAALIEAHEGSTGHHTQPPASNLCVLKNLPAKARALLDRLRRAEAVVEAALRMREDHREAFAKGDIPGTQFYSEHDLHKALAAWNAGKERT